MWLALAIACQQQQRQPLPITEIGNPERILGVGAATADVPDQPLIESAWAALGEIKLELDEAFVGEEELEWETPEVITDIASDPARLEFSSPNARYNRVTLRPRTDREGRVPGSPPELEEGSFVVSGTRGDGTPFLLVSDTEEEIELVGEFELVVTQRTLALGFSIDRWVDGAALDAAEVESGQIRIDRRHNEDLLDAFEDELPGSIVFADDIDGDGEVDDADVVLLD